MPIYYLTVKVDEPNPNYAAELAEAEKRRRERAYDNFGQSTIEQPREWVTRTTLDVCLTVEQWEAVRRAVLETFK